MNRAEFVKHVERCQKELRRFLTALCCGDTSQADDLAQDTLMKAYLSCDGLQDDKKFKSWVFRIAYNSFISSTRRINGNIGLDHASGLESSERSDSAFKYQALHSALARLSEKERASTLLFYMEGYSTKEIAAMMDSTSDAVKQQLSRARVHLKSMLDNER
ncbi:MAG: RNA polymerase sigma factor [Muribaculaceae bacterium]|nr:RNA polymerase sigma factor [Muribaculaceae bacterium]